MLSGAMKRWVLQLPSYFSGSSLNESLKTLKSGTPLKFECISRGAGLLPRVVSGLLMPNDYDRRHLKTQQ